MSKKIMFIAMQNSIHSERWIKQINKKNKIIIYPSVSGIKNKYFKKWTQINLISNYSSSKKIIFNYSLNKYLEKILIILIKRFRLTFIDITFLFFIIKKYKPDYIHTLEFQHAAYLLLNLKNNYFLKPFLPKFSWIVTNWGSDIFYFQKFDYHRKKIEKVLKSADYYSAECRRDYDIIKKYNHNLNLLPLMPNAGGLDLESIKRIRNKIKLKDRKIIIIKGYISKFGQADLVIKALFKISRLLKDYQIIFFSSSQKLKNLNNKLNYKKDLNIKIIDNSSKIHHNDMLKLFSKSKIYIGISRSDGISTSFLEAMALGVFPIQSSTSCCNEWVTHKKTGYIVKNNNIDEIVKAIKFSLKNVNILNSSFKDNWFIVKKRLSKRHNISIANTFYG